MEFGHLTSTRNNVSGVAPEDLSSHVYILGGTGSGKTTMIRTLFKHLECANYTGVLSNSIIYIDAKDDDSKLFLRQCERQSFDNDLVTYIDLNHTGFALNLLELPKHESYERDSIVSRMVGHLIEMFKEFYSQPQTYVQMERILRLLLLYLYSNTDNPSIIDLYELIVRLQKGGKTSLQQIFQVYRKTSNPAMKQALDSVTALPKEAWIPLLNRFEMFVTDSYLKNRFGVTNTTIDFDKMLVPGNITIFRISDAETPRHVHNVTILAIILKIWFMIQHRASKTTQEERSLVILALDEFQKIKDVSVITSILSQARSYNLGLVLSHQNLAQINTDILGIIVGNTATQIYGRVSGIDASRIGKIMDPKFAEILTNQLATQPDFVFTIKDRPPPGSYPSTPTQFRLDPPPRLILDENETEQFIQKMKRRHTNPEITQSRVGPGLLKKYLWRQQLAAPYRSKDEWNILLFLRIQNGNLRTITEKIGIVNRTHTSIIIQSLKEEGLIDGVMSKKHDNILVHEYALSSKAKDLYFPSKFTSIGKTTDVEEVATKAYVYYLNKGFFICLANQHAQRIQNMCDLVAYDFDNDIPISVEIESRSQISNNPEQVRFNMTKWKDLGFLECHVWSKSTKLKKIRSTLGLEADKVSIFSV